MKQCITMNQISEVASEVIAGRSEAQREVVSEAILDLSEALEKARDQMSVGIGLMSAVSGREDPEEEKIENIKI